MLTSIALVFLLGLLMSAIFKKLNLPTLLGMILTGIIIGPFCLNLLDKSILNISADLRKIALIIILTKAGLSLDIADLKKVGRPAVLLSFLPATIESIGIIIIAPIVLGVSVLEAAIMATVIAAVSPAVVVPRMVKLMEEGIGTNKRIPQMIMAGASIDDVFVIVVFTALVSLASYGNIVLMDFVKIPVSIALGLTLGIVTGLIFSKFIKKFHVRDSVKVIIILSLSFLFTTIEDILSNYVAVSGLLAVIAFSAVIYKTNTSTASRLSVKFSKLWIAAEIILFVLVGSAIDIRYAASAGLLTVIVVLVGLIFRMLGTYMSVLKTDLKFKEQLFCLFAYIPKATVQAAIGGIPLALGLECGQIVLTVAVVAILITAPLGAILIDKSYKSLLQK